MHKKTMVILHEFDDNVAVVATTVASITIGIVQFQANYRPWRSLVQVGVRFAYRRGMSAAPAVAVGVAAAAQRQRRRLPTSISP